MDLKKLKAPKMVLRAALVLVGAGLLVYLIGAGVAATRLPDEFVRARQSAAVTSHPGSRTTWWGIR